MSGKSQTQRDNIAIPIDESNQVAGLVVKWQQMYDLLL